MLRRVNWKPKEGEEIAISCNCKTCKTRCKRKGLKLMIDWDLSYVCNNYWNGKNWDKPERKEKEKPNSDDLFVIEEITWKK